MTITPMTVFWILLVTALLIGFGVLVSRQVKAGKEVGTPTGTRVDTHDMPPEGSDAEIIDEREHHGHEAAERKPDEFVDTRHISGG